MGLGSRDVRGTWGDPQDKAGPPPASPGRGLLQLLTSLNGRTSPDTPLVPVLLLSRPLLLYSCSLVGLCCRAGPPIGREQDVGIPPSIPLCIPLSLHPPLHPFLHPSTPVCIPPSLLASLCPSVLSCIPPSPSSPLSQFLRCRSRVQGLQEPRPAPPTALNPPPAPPGLSQQWGQHGHGAPWGWRDAAGRPAGMWGVPRCAGAPFIPVSLVGAFVLLLLVLCSLSGGCPGWGWGTRGLGWVLGTGGSSRAPQFRQQRALQDSGYAVSVGAGLSWGWAWPYTI